MRRNLSRLIFGLRMRGIVVGDLTGDGLRDVLVIDPSFMDANGDVVGGVRAKKLFHNL